MKAAKCSSENVICVRSKGGGYEFTSIAKRKKNHWAAAVQFWGDYLLSAITRANSDWEAQVITAALPLAHQPFFPREGQRFSSPGHTQII